MFRHWICVVILVSSANAGLAQDEPPRGSVEPKDVLSRPLTWGPEAQGNKLSLRMPRTKLLYGEPIVLFLESHNAKGEPPYLRVRWEEPNRSAKLSVTDERDQSIPFRMEVMGNATTWGARHALQIHPEGATALGRWFKPGKYRFQVQIDAGHVPGDATRFVGQLASNRIDLQVIEEGPRGRLTLLTEETQKRIAEHVKDLDDVNFPKRDAAEKALADVEFAALPLLEDAALSKSTEKVTRSRRWIMDRIVPVLPKRHEPLDPALALERGPYFALFGPATWTLIAEYMDGEVPSLYWLAIAHAPVGPYEDLSNPSADKTREVIARLADRDYRVRFKAVRALSKTTNQVILGALTDRVTDSFGHSPHQQAMFGNLPTGIAAQQEVAEAIRWQGKPLIVPLIAHCHAYKDRTDLARAVKLLADLGTDPRTLDYLSVLLESKELDDRAIALTGLAKLGPATVPLLHKVAKNTREEAALRRDAVIALGEHGDANQFGPFLIDLLKEKDIAVVQAAAAALGQLRFAPAAAELTRLASNEKQDDAVRVAAFRGLTRIRPDQETEQLLINIGMARACPSFVQGHALVLLAELKSKAAVPGMLRALKADDWFIRSSADRSLRLLANKPEGVGYRAAHPEPEKWQMWWKDK